MLFSVSTFQSFYVILKWTQFWFFISLKVNSRGWTCMLDSLCRLLSMNMWLQSAYVLTYVSTENHNLKKLLCLLCSSYNDRVNCARLNFFYAYLFMQIFGPKIWAHCTIEKGKVCSGRLLIILYISGNWSHYQFCCKNKLYVSRSNHCPNRF